MRSLAVIATALALWTQPASATTFGVSFGGSGVGTDRHAADYGYPPVIYTDTSGYFSFNLAFATPFGDGLLVKETGQDAALREISILGWLKDDTLYFSVRTENPVAPPEVDTLTMSLVFQDGYLADGFPKTFDSSMFVSGTYQAENRLNANQGNLFTSMGTFTWLGLGQSSDGPSGPRAFIYVNPVGPDAALPESATWALMLLGFGMVGLAIRRDRRKAPHLSS